MMRQPDIHVTGRVPAGIHIYNACIVIFIIMFFFTFYNVLSTIRTREAL